MEFFILGNKIEVNNGQHGWAVVKFKGYTMYVNAMVVCEESANYLDTVSVGEAITKYAKQVQREITAHEAYDALIEAFGGAKVICEAIEDEYVKAQHKNHSSLNNGMNKAQKEMVEFIKMLHSTWRELEDLGEREKVKNAVVNVIEVYEKLYGVEDATELRNGSEEYVHFYNKLNGKFLGGYSVMGTFKGELENTLSLKAYDHNISIDDIDVRYETKFERLDNQ